MNFDDKISRIIENQKIRKRLNELGIQSIQGPKGDKGDSLNITGSYDSIEELYLHHPTGKSGECYIISGNLYVWDTENNYWHESGSIQGPTGISEKIKIGNVETGEAGTNAQIIDNFSNNEHTLDFVIPKGDQGIQGIQGPKGDKGDTGEKGDKGDTGDTDTCDYFFNKINRNYSSIIPSKYTLE